MALNKPFINNLNKRTNSLPFTRNMRVLLCVLSFMFYVLFFELVVHSVGRGMGMMAIIPVLVAGGIKGLRVLRGNAGRGRVIRAKGRPEDEDAD